MPTTSTKIHRTLRMSPAMATGVTDRLWSVEDLVALWEARTAEGGKSGVMTKMISCAKCHQCIKIEGPRESTKEVSQPVTCPFCGEPNEVDWPMGAGYKAIRGEGISTGLAA